MIANYWHNLSERERWMLALGLVGSLAYLLYFLIYSPLTNAVRTKTAQLIEKQETLTWMQQAGQQAKNQTTKPINNAKLLALIGNQLASNQLKPFPYQLQQTGLGDIQLSFERVPFNHFLSWLWSINQTYAITINQISAEHTETAGIVKLKIVLSSK